MAKALLNVDCVFFLLIFFHFFTADCSNCLWFSRSCPRWCKGRGRHERKPPFCHCLFSVSKHKEYWREYQVWYHCCHLCCGWINISVFGNINCNDFWSVWINAWLLNKLVLSLLWVPREEKVCPFKSLKYINLTTPKWLLSAIKDHFLLCYYDWNCNLVTTYRKKALWTRISIWVKFHLKLN